METPTCDRKYRAHAAIHPLGTVPKISAYSCWNCQATHNRLQIEITYYPDSLLFVLAGFLPRVSSQRLNWSYSWPQNRYEDDRTEPYSCSSRCRGTYIRIQTLLQSTPVPLVLATSPSRGVSYQCNRCSGMGARKMFRTLQCSFSITSYPYPYSTYR